MGLACIDLRITKLTIRSTCIQILSEYCLFCFLVIMQVASKFHDNCHLPLTELMVDNALKVNYFTTSLNSNNVSSVYSISLEAQLLSKDFFKIKLKSVLNASSQYQSYLAMLKKLHGHFKVHGNTLSLVEIFVG